MVRAPGTLPIARVIIESSPLSTARMASKYNDDNVLEERVVKRTKKEARRDRKGERKVYNCLQIEQIQPYGEN